MPLHANAVATRRLDYFILTPKNERLSNDGNFDFQFKSNVRSSRNFRTISYNITVEASARVYSEDPSVLPRDSENIFFTIYLYKVGIADPVDQFTQAANGQTGSKTFSVSTGAEYYFIIRSSGSLGGWEYLKGSGDFSNIYIV